GGNGGCCRRANEVASWNGFHDKQFWSIDPILLSRQGMIAQALTRVSILGAIAKEISKEFSQCHPAIDQCA
ncbi:MAG TPA: hypothetical protein DCS85_12320, partial [Verrucomicrobiales bacterium]|nr:hypothetical protein [Verrucomicrobiales bacterium]